MPRRHILAAALLAATPAPALAQGDVTAQVRAEAEGHLQICMPAAPEVEAACERARQAFVADFLRARAGDYQAQRNVAFVLAGGPRLLVPGGPSRPYPVAQNNLQACAWRIVVASSGHAQAGDGDVADQRAVCGRLDAAGVAAAHARARVISGLIANAPVRNPPAR